MNDRTAIRAPTNDGGVVVSHSWEQVASLLIKPFQPAIESIPGHPWPALRNSAREQALTTARAYLRGLGEPNPGIEASGPLFLAGHQPELFHPGVWVKNFALQGLARRHRGVALNLIVDNDTVKSTSLRLPHPPDATHAVPYPVLEAFDSWAGEVPYEEQTIQEEALFASFAERIDTILAGWHFQPLLRKFWPEVLRQASRDPHFGSCFAAARRSLERQWQCHNLEVPLSHLCGGKPFGIFLSHILGDLPRFHDSYNGCVARYRHAYRIRSRNHPVPDLAVDGVWLEAPFWGWRPGQRRRGRIFARSQGGRILLRCDQESWPDLEHYQSEGCKIRSRALTTTLYARLFLADLFIHGIGGGKYDELTDAIARKFYGFDPPPYLVLSATRLLPIASEPVPAEDQLRLQRQIRDLHYNPDRLLAESSDPAVQALIQEKKQWVARHNPPPSSNRERHYQIRQLNTQLATHLDGEELHLRQRLRELEQKLAVKALLQRRDYSFVLYPEKSLQAFCQQFLTIP